MKKALPIAGVLLVVAAAAVTFLRYGQDRSRVRATALAPADTVLFVHLPDIRQSAIRWPRTSLAQIGAEPEVQAFLERPRQGLPLFAEFNARFDQVTQAAPREAFLAVLSVDSAAIPRLIAGFSFSGSQSAVEEMLTEARNSVRESWPAGKADIVTYAGAEIETYTDKDFVAAQTIHNGWCLVSTDLELLQTTIDRLDAKPGAPAALLSGDLYQKALAPLPGDADAVVFGRLESIADTLVPLLASAGQTIDQRQIDNLKKTKAFAAALKMDGAQLRDSVFIMSDQESISTVMSRRGLDLSTPETVLFYASTMPEKVEVPAESLAPLAMVLPGINSVEQALQKKGLKFADFGAIFGPELTFLMDWPANEAQPTIVMGFDVRDAVRAREFMDAATSGGNGWVRKEQGDALIYASPTLGMIPGPVMALAQNFVVAGFSHETVSASLDRLRAKQPSLGQSKEYQAAASQVSQPTEAFGYLDTARLFERSYGLLRPFLGMALAFSPDAGKYIDAGKLPPAEAITRHLTPSAYSQTASANGTLIESAGTLTFNQAIAGAVVAGAAAALPALQATLKTGGGMPGLMPPTGVQPSAPASPIPPAPGGVAPNPVPPSAQPAEPVTPGVQ